MRRRRLAATVAAWLGLVAPGGAPAAESALPDSFAGAFVLWGKGGRETTLTAWEGWLGRPPASVPALDYLDHAGWEKFRAGLWLPAFWQRADPLRRVVWSVPLTMPGTPLDAIAAGAHDADFEAAAKAIAATEPGAIIRLGWEMNVASTAWFAGPHPESFVRAYRRVAMIFRRVSADFRLDWCPSWGPQDAPAEASYPGDDVVDVVGLDVYDYARPGKSVEARWREDTVEAPFGLAWQKRFAAAHGKPMSYPEWGVGQAGDNPYFIEAMHDWLVANRTVVAYAAYFDVDGAWPTRLDGFPRSREAFRRLFRTAP